MGRARVGREAKHKRKIKRLQQQELWITDRGVQSSEHQIRCARLRLQRLVLVQLLFCRSCGTAWGARPQEAPAPAPGRRAGIQTSVEPDAEIRDPGQPGPLHAPQTLGPAGGLRARRCRCEPKPGRRRTHCGMAPGTAALVRRGRRVGRLPWLDWAATAHGPLPSPPCRHGRRLSQPCPAPFVPPRDPGCRRSAAPPRAGEGR